MTHEYPPRAAFRAYAAQQLGMSPEAIDGGTSNPAWAADSPHSHGRAWEFVMWSKEDPNNQVRGWVTAEAQVIAPDRNLEILLTEMGVWQRPPRATPDALAEQLADELVWTFGFDHRVVRGMDLDAEPGLDSPSLTLAADGSGTLHFFSLEQNGNGARIVSEVKVALTADHKARFTLRPYEPGRGS